MQQSSPNPILKAAMPAAKPFLKWAGGKTQLIKSIEKRLPSGFATQKYTFIEPFAGSGAVLFWLLNNYPNIEKAVVNDINHDLINTYKAIAGKPSQLVALLSEIQKEYHQKENLPEEKKVYYYQKRDLYNQRTSDMLTQAALFIFLNRTCFNGLYRVNRQNGHNVPMGSYKQPTICDVENIFAVSRALQKVEILCGDFEETYRYRGKNTLFYFDPPYKPLNSTSNFNSYAKDDFNDEQQIRLKNFCDKIHNAGHQWLLSNSDVKEMPANGRFFDELYHGYTIERVKATRRINSVADKRGELTELLISNYTNT